MVATRNHDLGTKEDEEERYNTFCSALTDVTCPGTDGADHEALPVSAPTDA